MTKTIAEHLKTGVLGEDIAVKFLENKRYKIIERNYRKQYGEIDIVAKKENFLYFFEVKTLSKKINVGKGEEHKPEDMVHEWKVKRLQKVIQAYLLEKDISNKEWHFGIVSVVLDRDKKKATVKLITDIIL